MVHVIKSLSADVLSANMPIGFVFAETSIANESIQKYKVILGILQRRMVIDVSPEDDGSSQATEPGGVELQHAPFVTRHRASAALPCPCCGIAVRERARLRPPQFSH